MLISASRRTDIPSYYSEWFFHRLKEGFVYARNPMNIHQVSHIPLSPEVVDGIIFWTKNPRPMLGRLKELSPYPYYFQFTVTSYQNDVEVNLPSKKEVIIPAFQKLSDQIGPDRAIWRYDPIFISDKYNLDYHFKYFERLAQKLKNHTRKCTISFIDDYKKTANNMRRLNQRPLSTNDKRIMGKFMAEIARAHGLAIDTCAEDIDLSQYGINHAHCIDDKLLEKITGRQLKLGKDKNQRSECGCVSSIDIGQYNTCQNGCLYCYANHSLKAVDSNLTGHNPNSPLITGEAGDKDRVTIRKVSSNIIPTGDKKLFD